MVVLITFILLQVFFFMSIAAMQVKGFLRTYIIRDYFLVSLNACWATVALNGMRILRLFLQLDKATASSYPNKLKILSVSLE